MNIAVFIISLAGFVALALAKSRHSRSVLGNSLSKGRSRLLHVGGWLALAAALGLGIYRWHFDVGTVTWLGWLSIAGLALVFSLPRWGRQPGNKTPERCSKMAGNVLTTRAGTHAAAHSYKKPHAVIACMALLLPLIGFTWQLLDTPDKPLLRADAVHGQIGPWAFTLAEKDQKVPEIAALDVPLKQFVIRFCDGCDSRIRMAYLKVRKPHSPRAAGNAFEGRGSEKTATIPLPRAATREDGIWLTVEGIDGQLHQQRFEIQRLSPALDIFIEERA